MSVPSPGHYVNDGRSDPGTFFPSPAGSIAALVSVPMTTKAATVRQGTDSRLLTVKAAGLEEVTYGEDGDRASRWPRRSPWSGPPP
jgi:hypothetical protein